MGPAPMGGRTGEEASGEFYIQPLAPRVVCVKNNAIFLLCAWASGLQVKSSLPPFFPPLRSMSVGRSLPLGLPRTSRGQRASLSGREQSLSWEELAVQRNNDSP